jgi:lysophospholipase L1-like esterase
MTIKIFSFIIFGLGLLFLSQLVTIIHFSKKVSSHTLPFQKTNPTSTYKVLFAGDSTAVGTGTSNNTKSTAGWFSQDYPDASIENHSYNGMKLKGMIDVLTALKGRHFDLAVLQIGANDILYFTSLKSIQERQKEVLALSKQIADKVIILHSGDLGKAPLFFWPFTQIYTWRTMKVREIYQANEDAKVGYVDIYSLEESIKDKLKMYAPDNLHLNDEGYHIWYDFIKTKMTHE